MAVHYMTAEGRLTAGVRAALVLLRDQGALNATQIAMGLWPKSEIERTRDSARALMGRLRRAGFVLLRRPLVEISDEGRVALVLDDMVAGDVLICDGEPTPIADGAPARRCRNLIYVIDPTRPSRPKSSAISAWTPPVDERAHGNMRAVLRREIAAWLVRIATGAQRELAAVPFGRRATATAGGEER